MPPASDCCGSTSLMMGPRPALEALSSFQMPPRLPRRGRRCSSSSNVGKGMPPSMLPTSTASTGSEAASSTRGERGMRERRRTRNLHRVRQTKPARLQARQARPAGVQLSRQHSALCNPAASLNLWLI